MAKLKYGSTVDGNEIWHTGNDGAGSGLDADKLDGKELTDIYVPTGTIIYFAGSTSPVGYLKANGAAVSRTVYSNLFSVIGTTYGAGDGSTTFNLPDLRGEFIRGWDDGRGVDSGRIIGSFQDDYTESHNHPYVTSGTGLNYNTSLTTLNIPRPRNIALLACIKY